MVFLLLHILLEMIFIMQLFFRVNSDHLLIFWTAIILFSLVYPEALALALRFVVYHCFLAINFLLPWVNMTLLFVYYS